MHWNGTNEHNIAHLNLKLFGLVAVQWHLNWNELKLIHLFMHSFIHSSICLLIESTSCLYLWTTQTAWRTTWVLCWWTWLCPWGRETAKEAVYGNISQIEACVPAVTVLWMHCICNMPPFCLRLFCAFSVFTNHTVIFVLHLTFMLLLAAVAPKTKTKF